MVSKASAADLLEEGFKPEQFGFDAANAAGWSDPGGYLAKVVDEAGRWTANYVGAAAYAAVAVDTYTNDCLLRAEVQYARAILFKRRIAFFDSAATVSNELPAYAERRGYAEDAQRAMECAEDYLAKALRALGIDAATSLPGTGSSVGMVETGRYSAVSA